MASYGHQVPAAAPRAAHPAAYGAPMPVPVATAPAGTFAPGTKIQVGNHRVVIQNYLSEGGFAHVYLVKLPKPVDGTDMAVLKRVAVPDKEALRSMRTEVETMKRLKGHRPIVTYIDSHASELRGGGYEVFLLMEHCNGGGLIDFMNTRLQHRLTEPEILHIFTDIAEGVACMHYLKPPLLHRDLKVENVLILSHGSQKRFKLCDFGSAAPPKPAPQTVVECRLLDEDVQKHTTMQYRSPEMIDVYRKQPIDEKSDIWALGVLLYKLCYYTTPFEDQGQLAILNASFRYPSYPVFSDRLKKLIAWMLRENPQARPNIYQVLREGCAMQGRDVPIQDIYSGKQRSEPQSKELSSVSGISQPKPVVGAVFSPPAHEENVIPDIVPMRRGRLPAAGQQAAPQQASKPSPSPMRVTNGDPFAALDTQEPAAAAPAAPAGDVDEFSSRFPSLDQFSLLHESGSKFNFDSHTPPAQQQRGHVQPPVEELADQVFAAAQSPPMNPEPVRPRSVLPSASYTPPSIKSPPPGVVGLTKTASAPPKPAEMSRAHAIINKNPELQAISSQTQPKFQPPAQASRYVSTGTMTTSPPPEQSTEPKPVWRVPTADHHRSNSLPRQPDSVPSRPNVVEDGSSGPIPRVPSYQLRPTHVRHPSSSRPSLEGGRPSLERLESSAQSRRSIDGRPRPISTHLESNLDFLREKEGTSKPLPSPSLLSPKLSDRLPSPAAVEQEEEAHIESNVDFLRSMEDSDSKKKDWGSKHGKRGSLSSLSGTKNILAGRFGDAFKRFEGNQVPSPARTPSPLKQLDRNTLTPIEGSEATDGRTDDGKALEETDDMTPAMRRELERLRLEEEERRVEAAAAEYRQRFSSQGAGSGGSAPLPKSIGGVSRAVSIQNRVQNLLNEGQKSSAQVPRTAQGYGVYTDAAAAANRAEKQLPDIPRKPVGSIKPRPMTPSRSQDVMVHKVRSSASEPLPTAGRTTPGSRPVAPRKPMHLNSLPTGGRPSSPPKQAQAPTASSEHLVGLGLPGRPVLEMTTREKDDYLQDFSKRFPSLGSIEMVERDLAAEAGEQRPVR
ncbi:Serine/threonine-protein kinase ppk30 [Colletotrichum chlorophyti]|uniref:non-specific serine/threonine protein kinase n=1 Tax=Colletotrichum chlorophyti TaxID=708187 RepID=A0A1Q8RBD3_9PEZI|nr:Serine/threonine-protein kinase ppk30 [Colletotrichum chlorophyti]